MIKTFFQFQQHTIYKKKNPIEETFDPEVKCFGRRPNQESITYNTKKPVEANSKPIFTKIHFDQLANYK